ncbi:FUSC family protein [Kosakonia sp. BK9b]
MNKTDCFYSPAWRATGEVCRRVLRALAAPAVLNDASALLYSAKSFAAAMLAYYIALSVGLQRPSWAIITVYIVSQTSVGASLSRSLYRLAGTVIGAGATVLIVPAFVNMPILCSAVLTGWITFCLFLSLLERTPRAYAFVLAGYTASLIGFPAVTDPGAMFDTAITRVQEITIGLFCAAVIHRYVLPKRLSGLFNSTLAETLRSARQRLADTLSGNVHELHGTMRLAQSLQFLQGISHHIPYDFTLSAPVRQARKAIHDRLARLLIVSGELRDRLQMINALPADLQRLLNDVQAWLTCEEDVERKTRGCALQQYGEQVMQQRAAHVRNREQAVQLSIARHLTEAVALLQQSERFAAAIHHAKPLPMEAQEQGIKGYVFHRDPLTAARTALGAAVIIFSGCLVWIFPAWPDGGTAVSILGVCCTLFGSFDTPAPHIVKYIIGSFWGVVISLLYSFALLPQVAEFPVLVAVLAPAYLLAGSLQARPPTTFMAMGITLTLPVLCELGAHYSGDFAAAVNTAIALFAATGFAVVGMSLLQTVQADAAINRLLALCRRDIRHSIKGTFKHDDVHWTNLMIDRTALLLPRLQRSDRASGQVLNEILHYLSLGLAVLHLRRITAPAGSDVARDINDVLARLSRRTDIPALRQRIVVLIGIYSPAADEATRVLTDRLVDLHCALWEREKEQMSD